MKFSIGFKLRRRKGLPEKTITVMLNRRIETKNIESKLTDDVNMLNK